MRTRWIAVILIVALLSAVAGCTSTGTPQRALGSYDLTAAEQALRAAAPPGGAALLVLKDGKIIEQRGEGRLGTASVVDIGTASQWLAAAAMMTLVDQGLITLDDPVTKYLPAFSGDKAGITLRQLWSFTSGLPAGDPSLTDRSISLETCVQKLSTLALQTVPGTAVIDSAVGIQIGARICEVVSGQSWEEFFQERIAEPLDMRDTSFAPWGFSRNPSVGSDARSTADDYGHFLTMLLQQGIWQGRRILSQQAVAAIEQDQAPDLSSVQQTPFTSLAAPSSPATLSARPGLGMWREQTDAAGKLIVASCPGTTGFLPWIDLSRNVAGVFTTRQSLSSAIGTYTHLQQLVDTGIAAGPRFHDVQTGSWAFSAIADCSARGLLQGYGDGTFHPDEALTRAQFARLICLAQKITPAVVTAAPFTDVPAASWAAGSIAAAVRQGLLSGYRDHTFRPEEPLTIAQALSVLARMGGWSAAGQALPYTDVPDTFWAWQAVSACFSHGLLKAVDPGLVHGTLLTPGAQCTRAQACVLLDRFLMAAH